MSSCCEKGRSKEGAQEHDRNYQEKAKLIGRWQNLKDGISEVHRLHVQLCDLFEILGVFKYYDCFI
jgi:hypothetical protein